MLAAIGVGGELLAPVLDPADGVTELARKEGGADLLGEQQALVTEAAADVGRPDADLAVIETQAIGETRAHDVRDLLRGVDQGLLHPPIPTRARRKPADVRHPP